MQASSTHWYLYLFAVGAASTALEIAGLRFLAPLFGTSLPVWGAAIATVIAGLALGYSHGGRRARETTTALTVVRYASLGAALFLLMPAVYTLAQVLPAAAALPLAFGILFLPSIIFGAVNPLAVQVESVRRGEPAGAVAGKISSLTTIGSLAGILLPSFLTIPFFGTRETTWIFAGATLLLGIPWLMSNRRTLTAILIFAASASLLSLIPSPTAEGVVFTKETPYQHVTVREWNGGLALSFDANLGIQSFYTSEPSIGGYWDYVAALPAFIPKEKVRVLVLGAAASTTERQMQNFWEGRKTFEFTSVELDGEIFAIANKYFHPPTRRMVSADGRTFAASDKSSYDIILVDAYSRELTIPFHLATQEFFETLAARLTDHGILVINANATSPDNIWIRSLARTVNQALPQIHLASIPNSCNHLLLATEQPLPEAGETPIAVTSLLPIITTASAPLTNGLLLTDNRAPTDWLGLAALLASGSTGCST